MLTKRLVDLLGLAAKIPKPLSIYLVVTKIFYCVMLIRILAYYLKILTT